MALPQMTPQQYADLVLSIWHELRHLPKAERSAAFDRILKTLKGES